MYLAGTLAGMVRRYDFDIAIGALASQRLPSIDRPFPRFCIRCNGRCGRLRLAALFRGGAVAQFDPEGELMLMRRIRLPVSNPAMCAFGGQDLDILYVISASRFLAKSERRAQPLGGHVLAIEGLGARGVPQPRFGA